ncbi:MAG: hypothetical protein JNL51_18005 [Chitinophagaceae bacterium]|nr:hypothetical protein [Chitinophagaceae bacterium]
MVKTLLKMICAVLFFLAALLTWLDQSRSFYCLSENKCITVWKRLGDKCYVIPGKYYGVFKPTNYIKTTNTQYLTIYFSSDVPNKMIVRNQGSSTGEKGGYDIVNNLPENFDIVEYSEEYRAILYKPDAIKFKDVKSNTDYLTINIKENYSTDKIGKKIK